MIEITLSAMRFHALVGILPHERTTPQPIEVDLRVDVADGEGDRRLPRSVRRWSQRCMDSAPIDFLEEIGERVARGALEHSSRVRAARVAVRKPTFRSAGPLAFAEVVVVRRADG